MNKKQLLGLQNEYKVSQKNIINSTRTKKFKEKKIEKTKKINFKKKKKKLVC